MLDTIFLTFGTFFDLVSGEGTFGHRERAKERDREREIERQRERSRFSDLYFISIEFNALQPLYSDGSSRSSHLDPFTVS